MKLKKKETLEFCLSRWTHLELTDAAFETFYASETQNEKVDGSLSFGQAPPGFCLPVIIA